MHTTTIERFGRVRYNTTTIERFGRVRYSGDWSGDIEFDIDDRPKAIRIPAEMVRAVARLMLADEIERAAQDIAERVREGMDPK